MTMNKSGNSFLSLFVIKRKRVHLKYKNVEALRTNDVQNKSKTKTKTKLLRF